MSKEHSGNGRPASGELDELRGLLIGPEQAEIAALRRKLDEPAMFAAAVSRVLAEAVRLRSSGDPRLRDSLEPIVEEVISTSVRRNPAILTEAIFPIVGTAVRKAVSTALQGLMESLNQVLEHSLSFKSVRWRLEAWRTGRPFAEILLLRSLRYRVEQVFLIHRQSGLVLGHRAADARVIEDADLISGMLTAIRDFVSDSFGAQPEQELETMEVGAFSVWIHYSPHAILAGVIQGTPPRELRSVFQEALERICQEHGEHLAAFDGDASRFESTAADLDSCLLGRLPRKQGRPVLAWGLTAVFLLAIVAGATLWYRAHQRWTGFLARLNSQPGIVVTSSGKQGGKYFVTGLRDPLAIDPATLARPAGIDAADVRFQWEPYVSLNPRFVSQRQYEAAKAAVERVAIHFATDRAELSTSQVDAVNRLAAEIGGLFEAAHAAGKAVRVEIAGHTDQTGKEAHNAKLAGERAERVFDGLVAVGVPPGLLTVRAAGSSEPVRAGDSPLDLELNRSVLFRAIP